MNTIRLLFSSNVMVTAKQYLTWGLSLALLKYLGELLGYYVTTSEYLTPLQFLMPLEYLRFPEAHGDMTFRFGVLVWTIPFVWIGASMTIRRALDAGYSASLGLLFFVPVLNNLLMVFLSFARSKQNPDREPNVLATKSNFVLCVAFALLFGLAAVGYVITVTNVFVDYGWTLFIAGPFISGMVQAYWLTASAHQSSVSVQATSLTSIVLASLVLFIIGQEGLICIVMAFPAAAVLSAIGASVGSAIGRNSKPKATRPVTMLLILPLLGLVEGQFASSSRDTVLTEVHINATPEEVWKHVISFPELPPTTDLLFVAGVAYPLSAHIEGTGVGAVRHCVFSTGTFVEPITKWEEARHLAFDVRSQPPTMRELSFYHDLHPQHLNGFFRSEHGEFNLIRQADGTTLLQGRTWYAMDIHPAWYWQIYAQMIVQRIHTRVLMHVKGLAEAQASQLSTTQLGR